jgi:hypothetical protein
MSGIVVPIMTDQNHCSGVWSLKGFPEVPVDFFENEIVKEE